MSASALHKNVIKSKLPPRCPRSFGPKLAPFGPGAKRDYKPTSWREYFTSYEDVQIDSGVFRVYLTDEPDCQDRPRIVTLHGGGYSGLSWSLFSHEITSLVHCQVISIDLRGHGESNALDNDDLSADTMVQDVEEILVKLFNNSLPPIVLIGHSMGGAIAVRTAHKLEQTQPQCIVGLIVIDVVEGTAMESLASMQSFLRSRPTHFESIQHAIEWCVRSGQVRNAESARVSMPSQIINCESGVLATQEVDDFQSFDSDESLEPPPRKRETHRSDVIVEESETDDLSTVSSVGEASDFKTPVSTCKDAEGSNPKHKYKWRIDLSKTESHWSGWFKGLSSMFLSVSAPKMLLLASIDGLDRELTVGQMQGKFQFRVLARCGHAVHEDRPDEVATAVGAFILRQRLSDATENGAHLHLTSMPGC